MNLDDLAFEAVRLPREPTVALVGLLLGVLSGWYWLWLSWLRAASYEPLRRN